MDSQNMYSTNLLSQDPQLGPTYGAQSGSSLVSLDDSPPLHFNNPTNVKRPSRGANFNFEEDKLFVSAWQNCSLDDVQGTDQKHSQLWEKVYKYFQQSKETTTERTIKTSIHRWSLIQKATKKFCSNLALVERLNQSCMTEHDKFEKVMIMYQSLKKCNFQFKHCCHLLNDQPKWISRATNDVTKKRRMMVSTPTPTLTQPRPRPQHRPQPHPQRECDRE